MKREHYPEALVLSTAIWLQNRKKSPNFGGIAENRRERNILYILSERR